MKKPKLLGNFASSNTALRVKTMKRKPKNLDPVQLTLKIKALPSELKYDYERQVRREEVFGATLVSLQQQNLLPPSSSSAATSSSGVAGVDVSIRSIPLPYVDPYSKAQGQSMQLKIPQNEFMDLQLQQQQEEEEEEKEEHQQLQQQQQQQQGNDIKNSKLV